MSSIEKATVTEFCTEVAALIPDNLMNLASKTFTEEISRVEKISGTLFEEDVLGILEATFGNN